MGTSQDVQAFQKDIALNKLSSITVQQARRNVILVDDASTAEHTIEKTLKQTADIFIQNLGRVSKMDNRDEKTDIDLEDMKNPDKGTFRSKIPFTTLQDEEFLKRRHQQENIITNFESTIYSLSNIPAALDTAALRKSFNLIEPETSSEILESSANPSSLETKGSENIGMNDIQMENPGTDSFTSLEAAAISCVLEECLNQLATIGFMIPADVDPRWDDSFKTIDETYGVPDEPRLIFREDMGLLPIVPTEAEKMRRDINYAYKVLENVLRDVRDNGRFDSLQREVDNIAKREKDEQNLEMNAQIWQNQAEQLRNLIESDKKMNEEDRKKTTKLAKESDEQIDHAILINSGKLDYAERWAKAKLEQQELKLHLEKRDMLNKLSDYTKEYNAEQIVSAEMAAYLETDIREKEEQIVTWTKKYNEEIVERQQEIDDLKKLIEDQKSDIEEMRSLITELQNFIAEEITSQEEEKLNKAAIIIQSIWRGHMVRHELGEYTNLQIRLKRRKKLSRKSIRLKKKEKNK